MVRKKSLARRKNPSAIPLDILRFIKRKHRGEKQLNGLPTFRHVMNVTRIISKALSRTGEGTFSQRRAIILGALGHDLFEGTDATKKEVRILFGPLASAIIWGITDEWDKKKPGRYARKVSHAQEAVRVLKLADHVDNYTHTLRRLPRIGRRHVRTKILPILEPMRIALNNSRFRTYKRSAAYLNERVASLAESLRDAVQ